MQNSNTYINEDLISDMLFGKESYITEFVESAEDSFAEFSEHYTKYLLERDETNFRKAGHKIKPVAQMLHIDEIIEEYEHAKRLIWNEEEQEKLEASAQKMEGICDQILEELEQIKKNS